MGRKTNNGFAEPSGFGEFLFVLGLKYSSEQLLVYLQFKLLTR